MNEQQIENLLERINKAKYIIERTNEIQKEITLLINDKKLGMNGGTNVWDLHYTKKPSY